MLSVHRINTKGLGEGTTQRIRVHVRVVESLLAKLSPHNTATRGKGCEDARGVTQVSLGEAQAIRGTSRNRDGISVLWYTKDKSVIYTIRLF